MSSSSSASRDGSTRRHVADAGIVMLSTVTAALSLLSTSSDDLHHAENNYIRTKLN